jgi:spore coat protein CotH
MKIVRGVLVWGALACAVAAQGATREDLFDTSQLHDVRISMSAADWARLRASYFENTRYDATLTIDGETIGDSTVRSRGSGTRNGTKPGLLAEFARKKNQTFRGLTRLVIDNMYNDASFLRERLAFAAFTENGIRVPREAFARLTVNGEYWGLYALVEPVDAVFVSTHFDDGRGNLFEYEVPPLPDPSMLLAWDFTLSRGSSIDDYVPVPFEPETNEDDLDGSALLAFIRTVTEVPDATFLEEITRFIDPEVILTYFAVEVATAEVDGLTGGFGPNNFYLYQLSGTTRFVFIPWDHDFNFTQAGHAIYHGARRNRIIERLLADPAMKAFYEDRLQWIVGQYVNPGWITPRIDAMVAQIRPSVLEDVKRRGGDDPATAAATFDDAVAHIRSVVEGRGASVEAQLKVKRRRTVFR